MGVGGPRQTPTTSIKHQTRNDTKRKLKWRNSRRHRLTIIFWWRHINNKYLGVFVNFHCHINVENNINKKIQYLTLIIGYHAYSLNDHCFYVLSTSVTWVLPVWEVRVYFWKCRSRIGPLTVSRLQIHEI